ncbi:HEAT repeat domain-containing protein [Cohnella faecalis]|uniref:HEAT repeat domain-containing protein n=2 Tax=Cohnella faecalis TaxID=2315694 RepID=A0A398CU93_9BACL|nr:HEAT repeat domain-containing protein [Cohnella faecalis]
MKRAITPDLFLKEFTVDISKNPAYVRELLEKAYIEQEADDVEYLMIAIFRFELFLEDITESICKLMNETWHFQHENIASMFQKVKSPRTIECLYNAALTQFEYLEYDEAFALAVKCIWALGDINTLESRKKLMQLTQSENEIIKENATKQLNRSYN